MTRRIIDNKWSMLVARLFRQTLSSTNAKESVNFVCMGDHPPDVQIQEGSMILRYAAEGFLKQSAGFVGSKATADSYPAKCDAEINVISRLATLESA